MTRILVVSEQTVHSIEKITLGILGKLTAYETEVAIIDNIEPVGIELIRKYGVTRINLLKGNSLLSKSPEAYIHALKTFIENNNFDVVITGATSIGNDVFPSLSSLFDSGLASAVSDFFFKDHILFGIKELYGGKCLVDVELLDPKPWFMTVIPGALETLSGDSGSDCDCDCDCDCEIVDFKVPDCDIRAQIYKTSTNTSDRPLLEDAEIVVAGGRGLTDGAKLSMLEELADTLNAALGASGGAIGNDYAPKEYLIGQTGTHISPLLYIACGISGASQHLAGIRNAKKILAINTDANAPLMRMADYAIVGNFHDIIPVLNQQIISQKQ